MHAPFIFGVQIVYRFVEIRQGSPSFLFDGLYFFAGSALPPLIGERDQPNQRCRDAVSLRSLSKNRANFEDSYIWF